MKFTKWVRITNNTTKKFIDLFIEKYPQLLNEKFVVSEKLDGANFSVLIDEYGTIKSFAKRSGIVKSDESFYNYKAAFQNFETSRALKGLQFYCADKKKTIQAVGELFGKGVQKRIYYGDTVQWNVYALYEYRNDEVRLMPFEEMFKLFKWIYSYYGSNMPSLLVPIFGTEFSLKDALEFDIYFTSKRTPLDYEQENLAEGIVIRPYEKDYHIEREGFFIVKKKNEKFLDREVKKQRTPKIVSKEEQEKIDYVLSFVNKNRTLDLFSKYGEFDDIRKTGEYIKYYVNDVFEDIRKNDPAFFTKLLDKEGHSVRKALSGKIKEELFSNL